MKRILFLVFFSCFYAIVSWACVTSSTQNITVCSGSTVYDFNGNILSASGTYYDTLLNAAGCDSIITLNLIINSSSHSQYDTICANGVYVFNGQNLTSSGVYEDTLVNAKGCDSFLTLFLTVKAFKRFTIRDTVCQGDSVLFNGVWRKFPATYLDTLIAADGCDSFLSLALRIKLPTYKYLGALITCSNVPYIVGDSSFTTPGFHTAILRNSEGCDSIVSLNLTVFPVSYTTLNRTICDNNPYFFRNQLLNKSGVYYDTLKNRRNCDSFITLNLTVHPTYNDTIHAKICEGDYYVFDGIKYYNTGIYRAAYRSVNNCDSIRHLILTVNRKSSYIYYRKFCSNDPVFFGGKYIDTPGVYYDTILNAAGCDSAIKMYLQKDIANYFNRYDTICFSDSIYFGNKYISSEGTYIWTYRNMGGCDSVVTMYLTKTASKIPTIKVYATNVLIADSGAYAYKWYLNGALLSNPQRYYRETYASGIYSVELRDKFNCVYKSNGFSHNQQGGTSSVNGISLSDLKIYPNPSQGTLYIESSRLQSKNVQLHFFNMDGKLSKSLVLMSLNGKISLKELNLPKGIYFLEIQADQLKEERKIMME